MLHDTNVWGLVFLLSEWIIRLSMLAVVPLRRTPQAASAWLLLILVFPWPGLVLYHLIGWPKQPRWRTAQLERLPRALAGVIERLRANPNVVVPVLMEPGLAEAAKLASRLTHLQPLAGNSVELLDDYNGVIERLVADIDAAANHVHLLFYIYGDDPTADRVTAALSRAVKRGVACRVLIDTVGSKAYARTLVPKLEAAGVAVHRILPVGFFRRRATRYDLRNHRKIAVIDGRIGYTGSQNLVAADFKKGLIFEELMVRVTGPVVLQLQYVFVEDWFLETGEILNSDAVFPDPRRTGDTTAQVLPSGPNDPQENNHCLILSLAYNARRRIVITTPYFIPDQALLQALQNASLRGVDVHLILSSAMDQLLVGLAQRSYYEEMLEAGIKIHLYREAFLHAKHLSVDDEIALIGSSNMDVRSFLLNSEVMLVCHDRDVASRLRAVQERYFARSELLTLSRWNERSHLRELGQNLARLMSPLL